MKTKNIFCFTFQNRMTLEISPICLCLGDNISIAEKKARKFFPRYLFDIHKCMQVTNNHFCALLAADNINLENYLYEN